MARLPVKIPAGIVVDDTTYSVGETAWSDANCVRFWRSYPQTIGGWQSVIIGTTLTGVCRTVFPWTDNLGTLDVAFGTHSNLQLYQSGSLYDITPATFVPGNVDGTGGIGYGTGAYGVGTYGLPSTSSYYAMTWTLSAYGQSLIANPRGQTIYQWNNDTTQPAQPLANAPANVACALAVRTRQIMAFGCNDEITGVFNPLCIRYSDIENITSWTTTATNNAGEYILTAGGRIIAARAIGDYVLVWTDNSVHLATYTGVTSAPWTFTRVGDKCGLAGPNACVVVDQRAFWFTPAGTFYSYELGGSPALVVSSVVVDIDNNLSQAQADKIVMSSCNQFSEIRMDYPDARDGNECSRYVAFCTVDGAWTRGVMARTAYVDANPSPYPIAVTPGGVPYFHEIGQTADGAALPWFVKTADMYLSDEPERYVQVQGVWPDIQGQVGGVNLTILTRAYPQGPTRTKGPYALSPNQSRRDFQTSGRIVQLLYAGNSAPAFARIGKPVYDVVQTGVR